MRFWRSRDPTASFTDFLPNPAKQSKLSREVQRFVLSAAWFLLPAKDFARPHLACVWRHSTVRRQSPVKKEHSLFFPLHLNLSNVLELHCIYMCVYYTHITLDPS